MAILDAVLRGGGRLSHWICRIAEFWDKVVVASLCLCLAAGGMWCCLRYIPPQEMRCRMQLIQAAESYLGCNEADGSHQKILGVYNAQQPLPREYAVTDADSWCAVFCSAAALQAGLGEQIPLECSCGQLIELFDQQGQWIEDDAYLPQAGDYILYDWDNTSKRDSGGWPDHVGIVVQTFGPVIKVIEGNKDDMVTYRYVFVDDLWIRGYGTPNFTP